MKSSPPKSLSHFLQRSWLPSLSGDSKHLDRSIHLIATLRQCPVSSPKEGMTVGTLRKTPISFNMECDA